MKMSVFNVLKVNELQLFIIAIILDFLC